MFLSFILIIFSVTFILIDYPFGRFGILMGFRLAFFPPPGLWPIVHTTVDWGPRSKWVCNRMFVRSIVCLCREGLRSLYRRPSCDSAFSLFVLILC